MKIQHWKLAIAAIAVIVPVAGAVSVLTSRTAHGTGSTAATRPSASTTKPSSKAGSPPSARTWRPQAPVRAVSSDAPAAPEQTREERVARKIQRASHEEATFVDAFDAQPVDTSWAPTWERNLDQNIHNDLGELGGFSDAQVECRTSKCLATVTWDNYDSARIHLGETIHLTKGACATFSFMPPPNNPSGAYAHKVRFDGCASDEES